MKKFFYDNYKFLLFVLIGGLVGGYFSGIYMYDLLSSEILEQLHNQNITKELLTIISMIQYGLLYGFILSFLGIFLSKKVNLWKKFELNKKVMLITIILSIIGALILFPGDKLIFGSLSTWVNEQYSLSPTGAKIIAGLLVGGIIEEVMMRLFLMSLFVFIISKLFFKNKKEIPTLVLIISNVLTSLLFAAGHLPATASMTLLTPLIIIRCFLLNGGFGLMFGYLYRKYGIGYAMISHGLCHFISDILMIIFI